MSTQQPTATPDDVTMSDDALHALIDHLDEVERWFLSTREAREARGADAARLHLLDARAGLQRVLVEDDQRFAARRSSGHARAGGGEA